MKHLLNNLSEEEKNSIREQHIGGMKVMTENFHKMVNKKLGHVELINEQKSDTKCQLLKVLQQKSSILNVFKSEEGNEGCKIYRGVLQQEIIPNLTKEIITQVEKETGKGLINSLYELSSDLPCDVFVKVYSLNPTPSSALQLSKLKSCGNINSLLYNSSPNQYLRYVRSLYGKMIKSIMASIKDSELKNLFSTLYSSNDVSVLKDFNNDSLVGKINNLDDNIRKSVIDILRVYYNPLGFDSSGNKVERIYK